MPEETRKVDTGIAVGDTVKSYDFDYGDDCYVQGKVVGFTVMDGSERYVIVMDKKVFGGKDETEKYLETTGNYKFYPPVNGLETWMGSKTCGVKKI